MITFRRAVRESVPLIIGVAGASGSGKTYSAMRLATGLAGGKPFAVIDTEAGRAKHYAGEFVFDHADLRSPFRPSTYRDAIEAADKAGYPVIVVDSCSHEHAGHGGLLDWHEEELERMSQGNESRRENNNMRAWIKPKMEHKKMMDSLLQLRSHVILCFRAEQKIEMRRNPQTGKTEIVPKEIASGFKDWIPICEKNMLYELTASFLLIPGEPGIPHPIKLQEQMRKMMDLSKPINEDVGRQLAQWAKGEGVAAESSRSAPATSADEGAVAPPADTLTPQQDVTIGSWSDILNAIQDDPELRGLLITVKKSLGLDTLIYGKLTKDQRIGFFAKFKLDAELSNLGPRVKALGL